MLDEMRRSLDADVALLPTRWIAADVLTWLRRPDSPPGPVNWLSGYVLQRILFRAEPVVRVTIEAAELASTLSRVLSQAQREGAPVCGSGLGLAADCPLSRIDREELSAHARPLAPSHEYAIALPESLARASGLSVAGARRLRDIFRPLDRRLSGACRGSRPAAPAGADRRGTLGERLEARLDARPQRFVVLDPLALAFNFTGVDEPAGEEGLFGNLDTDSSNARDNRQVVADAALDVVPFDTPAWRIHVPAEIRLDRRDLEAATSFDLNDFLVGLRGDYQALAAGGRGTVVFGGLFVEGDLSGTERRVQAGRGPAVTFATRRAFFSYASIGVELPCLELTRGGVTVARVLASLDAGQAMNAPVGVRLGDRTFGLEQYIREGPAGILRDAIDADPGLVTPDTPFGFVYDSVGQVRVELDARTDSRFRGAGRMRTQNRFRVYNQTGREPSLATRWSWRARLFWESPFRGRWSVAPFGEVTLVGVRDVDGLFRVVRAGVALQVRSFWRP